jgi:hypothetical protein
MTLESQLYATRRSELDELITAHLAADSLDEGNAGAFDALIEAWLQEELARIDLAEAAHAHDEAAAVRREANHVRQQAALEARAHNQRLEAEVEAEARRLRRQKRQDDAQRNKVLVAEARRARRTKLLTHAEQRLEAAAARFIRAEQLLLGDLLGSRSPSSANPPYSQDPSTAERAA